MRTAFSFVLSVALAGCSFLADFDDLRGEPDGSVAGAPLATIGFPPAGRTGAHSVTVRGTVTDHEGDEVTEVRVNEVVATVEDGAWSANVPLGLGENVLEVGTTDSSGATTDSAASVVVVREPILRGAMDMSLDAANGQLLVVTAGIVGAVDLDDMEIHAVSDAARGTGFPLLLADAIAVDPEGPTAIVASLVPNQSGWSLAAVDVPTGDRSAYSASVTSRDLVVDPPNDRVVVSAYTQLITIDRDDREQHVVPSGSGPTIGVLGDVTLDTMVGHVLVVNYDNTVPSILRVNLADGVRTVFSGTGGGSGPTMTGEVHTELDVANDRVLAVSGVDDGVGGTDFVLMEIAIADGAREILSGPGVGDGPALAEPGPVVLDAPRGRVLVLDTTLEQILAIDLENGDRTVALDLAPGADRGDAPCLPLGAAIDPVGARVLTTCFGGLVEGLAPWITATSLETGATSLLSGTGAGEVVEYLTAIDVDDGRALVIDQNLDTIFAVDLATGVRTIASGAGAEFGVALGDPKDVAVDPEHARALIVTGEVLAMDLATGARSELSGATAGNGETFRHPLGIGIDVDRDRAIVIDACDPTDDACVDDRLLAVDFGTGARTILSDPTHGGGTGFVDLVGIAIDGDRALVSDRTLRAILSVELDDGERAILAQPGLETGVPILVPTLLSFGAFDVDRTRRWAVLADPAIGIVVMDLVTGETIATSF